MYPVSFLYLSLPTILVLTSAYKAKLEDPTAFDYDSIKTPSPVDSQKLQGYVANFSSIPYLSLSLLNGINNSVVIYYLGSRDIITKGPSSLQTIVVEADSVEKDINLMNQKQ